MQTALLFPGQGSQEFGMGRDVAENSSQAMEMWKKAEKISGLPLREIYWEDGDTERMANTAHLQPALTVVNLSLWQEMATFFPLSSVGGVAGHSLGEYAALVAASALSLDDALHIVSLRGKLMSEADPDGIGAMAAVLKLSRETVQGIVDEVAKETGLPLLIANYNTPVQYVISGHKEAIELATARIKEQKGRALPLPVAGAFHSPLMDKAAAELARALDKVTWSKSRFPVYCNVTGKGARDGETLQDLARKQMTSSVFWTDSIAALYADGMTRFVELGPKGVLSRMVPAILGDAAVEVASISTWEALQAER